MSFEHPYRLAVHPPRGRLVVVGVQAGGGVPQVLQDVHEVDDDRDFHFAFAGLEFDPLDLVVGAVDQRDPGAAVVGVAALCLIEHAGDHGRRGSDDAGAQPFVSRDRPRAGS